MCYQCMKEEHTQYMLELNSVYDANKVITFYHEGFTAPQIVDIVKRPIDYVTKIIEERA